MFFVLIVIFRNTAAGPRPEKDVHFHVNVKSSGVRDSRAEQTPYKGHSMYVFVSIEYEHRHRHIS